MTCSLTVVEERASEATRRSWRLRLANFVLPFMEPPTNRPRTASYGVNGSATPAIATVPPVLQGVRGLNNLGNTCFMNTVLQVLLHCPPFMHFFLGDHHNRFACLARRNESAAAASAATAYEVGGPGDTTPPPARRPCLACEMDALVTQCFSGKTAPYSPHAFLHAMWCTAEYFAGYEQQDAHEFLIAGLASIYAGLAAHEGPARPLTPLDSLKRPPSALPRSFRANDLQRVFTGVLRSDVTCLQCHGKSTKYEDFQDISLDLSRLSGAGGATDDDGSGCGGASGPPTPGGGYGYHTSLAACLRSFTRAERLSFNERCWCSKCGALQDSAKQLSVHRLPNVLVFHLKRFKHSAHSKQASTKIDSFVEFPLHSLNMRPHTSAYVCSGGGGTGGKQPAVVASTAVEPSAEQLYDLFGVVVHHGTMQSGHYTNYVRNQADWFHCDDALVTPASPAEVRSSIGYLLFYQQKKCS